MGVVVAVATRSLGRGGRRKGVLADFLIGAHAAVRRIPLLTRDVARYRSYFPTVLVVGPGIA